MTLDRRFGPAFAASLATHVAIGALAFLAARSHAATVRSALTAAGVSARLVWLGGGGGGGNGLTAPPRRVQRPGRDSHTVAAAQPPTPVATARPIDSLLTPLLIVPIVTRASGAEVLPGAMDAPPAPPTLSQGPGSGGGAGPGIGTGDGPGRGRGLGDGLDRGTGGEAYRPGDDVSMPIEIRKGTPQYTVEAMRARAQGSIMVECVVQTNGVCANIRVHRSFNPAFGLDQEAIRAAEQWRFRPGTRRGEPVPVLVTLEIAFAVR